MTAEYVHGFAFIDSHVYYTEKGTAYLKEPGVSMMSKPYVEPMGMLPFLSGFKNEFDKYIDDPVRLTDAEQIVKQSGQLCYASFSEKRTWNKDAGKYLGNIRKQGHGSVLEHANFSFLLWGISRSVTHELVRHRSGMSYSQISQRYVDGEVLRFVERPEYQEDENLHGLFERRIDHIKECYEATGVALLHEMSENTLSGTERRKAVNQAARSVLPNETEAPIMVTGNVRAWRHILEMRCSPYADVEIRELAYRIYLCLVEVEPLLFADYRVVEMGDGTHCLETDTPKV